MNLNFDISKYIGKTVCSVLDSNWRGQIIGIVIKGNQVLFECTYFDDNGPKVAYMHDFEVEFIEKKSNHFGLKPIKGLSAKEYANG